MDMTDDLQPSEKALMLMSAFSRISDVLSGFNNGVKIFLFLQVSNREVNSSLWMRGIIINWFAFCNASMFWRHSIFEFSSLVNNQK